MVAVRVALGSTDWVEGCLLPALQYVAPRCARLGGPGPNPSQLAIQQAVLLHQARGLTLAIIG